MQVYCSVLRFGLLQWHWKNIAIVWLAQSLHYLESALSRLASQSIEPVKHRLEKFINAVGFLWQLLL
ncbi:hypothetical protein NDA00_25890 [Funiculus sociatus GB2-M2]|uniref:hypothetical protein n=1 Tax=Funiculus sociatus TaxID=450527 RepID=UPI00329A7905